MRFLLACALLLASCNSEKSLRMAHETTAILVLRNVTNAEVQYYAQHGHYGATFAEVGSAEPDASGGYVFKIETSPAGYVIHADPVESGTPGSRHFYTDQAGVIRQSAGDPANASSPEVP